MEAGPNESAPLVRGGVFYLPNSGDVIKALDARSGDLIWEYRRELPSDVDEGSPVAVAGPIHRNIAIWDDGIFVSTTDAHVIRLDANTGELVWETEVGDYHHITHTSGPIIVNGKVISGRTCDMGLPGGCYITAHDTEDGRELWRFYPIPRPGEPGDETWGGLPFEKRFHVGAWFVGSYDPELDLIYWGTSVPAPSPEILRGTGDGENALLQQHRRTRSGDRQAGVVLPTSTARQLGSRPPVRAGAGRCRSGAGQRRHVGEQSERGRRGEAQGPDRDSRQERHRLDSRPRNGGVPLGAGDRVPKCGRPDRRRDRKSVGQPRGHPPEYRGQLRLGVPWRQRWQKRPTTAYSPKTGLLYAPLQNLCMEPTIATTDPKSEDWYATAMPGRIAPEKTSVGRLEADLGSHGQDFLDIRGAGGHVLGPHDRRWSGLRRQLQSQVPSVRRREWRHPLADDPERPGDRLPVHLRGRRRAIRFRGGGWWRPVER